MASFIFNHLLQSPLKGIARGTQNFLGDQGPFPLIFGLQILERIMRCSAGLAHDDRPHRKSKGFRSGLLGPVFLADERRDVCLNSPLRHSWSMWGRWVMLKGSIKVLPRSALGPMATVHLSKCPRCTAGCSISLLRARKRGETFQWLWRPPKP